MEKPEIPELKIASQQSYMFILNFYQSLTGEETKQKKKYYMQKSDYLTTINCQEEIIWKYKDQFNLLI